MTEVHDDTAAAGLGPRSVERPSDAGSTLVAGLEGTGPSRVDDGGLVSPIGADWSVDWWVGADDRWHIPAREPSVRQRRVGHGPVIETSLRVPSGDVVQTVYPVVFSGGTATVIEISNESPVPVALALALRPYDISGQGPADGTGLRLDLDGDAVLIDGAPGLILPRKPNATAASTDDLFGVVTSGEDLTWDGHVYGPGANAVCLYPLPHKTSLRFAIPGPGSGSPGLESLPDSASVARGWAAVVDRATRCEFPDSGITALSGAARARLLLAAADLPDRVVRCDPDAGPILSGLAEGGHVIECRAAVEAFARSFPTAVTSAAAGELTLALGRAVRLLDDAGLAESVLEPLAQLTHLVDRAVGRRPAGGDGALGDVALRDAARTGLAMAAELVGQKEAAAELRAGLTTPEQPDLTVVSAMAERATPARRWDGSPQQEATGASHHWADDPVAAARFWLAARHLLVSHHPADSSETIIDLLPGFPSAWRGGTVEVHRLPVAGTLVSFAVRWHGYRPALLWDVETSSRPTRLRCPGLDPDWESTEPKGEALLTGAAEQLPSTPSPGDSFT